MATTTNLNIRKMADKEADKVQAVNDALDDIDEAVITLVGAQQPAIADSTGTAIDNARAINAVLAVLRTQGRIA